MPIYLLPFYPLAGFLVALAIGFEWASVHEYRAQRAPVRVRKGER